MLWEAPESVVGSNTCDRDSSPISSTVERTKGILMILQLCGFHRMSCRKSIEMKPHVMYERELKHFVYRPHFPQGKGMEPTLMGPTTTTCTAETTVTSTATTTTTTTTRRRRTTTTTAKTTTATATATTTTTKTKT